MRCIIFKTLKLFLLFSLVAILFINITAFQKTKQLGNHEDLHKNFQNFAILEVEPIFGNEHEVIGNLPKYISSVHPELANFIAQVTNNVFKECGCKDCIDFSVSVASPVSVALWILVPLLFIANVTTFLFTWFYPLFLLTTFAVLFSVFMHQYAHPQHKAGREQVEAFVGFVQSVLSVTQPTK